MDCLTYVPTLLHSKLSKLLLRLYVFPATFVVTRPFAICTHVEMDLQLDEVKTRCMPTFTLAEGKMADKQEICLRGQ